MSTMIVSVAHEHSDVHVRIIGKVTTQPVNVHTILFLPSITDPHTPQYVIPRIS